MSQLNGSSVVSEKCPSCEAFWHDQYGKWQNHYVKVGWIAFVAAAVGMMIGYAIGLQAWRILPWPQ